LAAKQAGLETTALEMLAKMWILQVEHIDN